MNPVDKFVAGVERQAAVRAAQGAARAIAQLQQQNPAAAHFVSQSAAHAAIWRVRTARIRAINDARNTVQFAPRFIAVARFCGYAQGEIDARADRRAALVALTRALIAYDRHLDA